MPDNQNQPRKDDAVLGGKSPPPVAVLVLGGIEGVKLRLSSPLIEARVAALSSALNYGDTGLDLAIQLSQLEVQAIADRQKHERDKEEYKYSRYCSVAE